MFVIPFIFAFYPELLIIDAAKIDPYSSSGEFLPGYSAGFKFFEVIWLLLRLGLALYMISSALAKFDRVILTLPEVIIRIIAAVMIIMNTPSFYMTGLVVAVLVLIYHQIQFKSKKS